MRETLYRAQKFIITWRNELEKEGTTVSQVKPEEGYTKSIHLIYVFEEVYILGKIIKDRMELFFSNEIVDTEFISKIEDSFLRTCELLEDSGVELV